MLWEISQTNGNSSHPFAVIVRRVRTPVRGTLLLKEATTPREPIPTPDSETYREDLDRIDSRPGQPEHSPSR
jgi:hypothetical protein